MGRLQKLRKRRESLLASRYLANANGLHSQDDNDTSLSKRSTTATSLSTRSGGSLTPRKYAQEHSSSMDTSDNSSLASKRTSESRLPVTQSLPPSGRVGEFTVGDQIGRSINSSLEYVANWDPCRMDTTHTEAAPIDLSINRTTSVLSGASTQIATNRAIDIAMKQISQIEAADASSILEEEEEEDDGHSSEQPSFNESPMVNPSTEGPTRLAFGTPHISARRLEAKSILSVSSNESSRPSISTARSSSSSKFKFPRNGKLTKHVIRQARKGANGPIDCDVSLPTEYTDHDTPTLTSKEQSLSSIGVEVASRSHFPIVKTVMEGPNNPAKFLQSSRSNTAAVVSPSKLLSSQNSANGVLGAVETPPRQELSRISETTNNVVNISTPLLDSPQSSADPVFCPNGSIASSAIGVLRIDEYPGSPDDSSRAGVSAAGQFGVLSPDDSSRAGVSTVGQFNMHRGPPELPAPCNLDEVIESTFNDEGDRQPMDESLRGSFNAYDHPNFGSQEASVDNSEFSEVEAIPKVESDDELVQIMSYSSSSAEPSMEPGRLNLPTHRMPTIRPSQELEGVMERPESRLGNAFPIISKLDLSDSMPMDERASTESNRHQSRSTGSKVDTTGSSWKRSSPQPRLPQIQLDLKPTSPHPNALDHHNSSGSSPSRSGSRNGRKTPKVAMAFLSAVTKQSSPKPASSCPPQDEKTGPSSLNRKLSRDEGADNEFDDESVGIQSQWSAFDSLTATDNRTVEDASQTQSPTRKNAALSSVQKARAVFEQTGGSNMSKSVPKPQPRKTAPAAPDTVDNQESSFADRMKIFGHHQRIAGDNSKASPRNASPMPLAPISVEGEKGSEETQGLPASATFQQRVNLFSGKKHIEELESSKSSNVFRGKVGALGGATHSRAYVPANSPSGVLRPVARKPDPMPKNQGSKSPDFFGARKLRPITPSSPREDLPTVNTVSPTIDAPRPSSVKDRVMQFSSSAALRPLTPGLQNVEKPKPTRPMPISASSLLVSETERRTKATMIDVASYGDQQEESFARSSFDYSHTSREDASLDVESDSEYTDGVTLDLSIADVSILTTPTALESKADEGVPELTEDVLEHMKKSRRSLPEPSEAGSSQRTGDNTDVTELLAKRSHASSSQTSEAAAPLIAKAMRMKPMSDELSTGDSFFAARAAVARRFGKTNDWEKEDNALPSPRNQISDDTEEKKVDDTLQNNEWASNQVDGAFPDKTSGPSGQDMFDFDSGWQPFEHEVERDFFQDKPEQEQGVYPKEAEQRLLRNSPVNPSKSFESSRSKTPTRQNRSSGLVAQENHDRATFRERAVRAALQANNVPLAEYQSHAYYYDSKRVNRGGGHYAQPEPQYEATVASPPSFKQVFGRPVSPEHRASPVPRSGEPHSPARSLFGGNRGYEYPDDSHYPRSDPGGDPRYQVGFVSDDFAHASQRRYHHPVQPSGSPAHHLADHRLVQQPRWQDDYGYPPQHPTPTDQHWRGGGSHQYPPQPPVDSYKARERLYHVRESRRRRSVRTTTGEYNMPHGYQLPSERYHTSEADDYSNSTMSSTRFGGSTFLSALDLD